MNAKKIIPLSIVCLITISGCASTSPKKQISYSNVSIPQLNKVTTTTLGEKLLVQGTGYHADTITMEPLDAYAADFTGGVFFNIPGTDTYQSNEKNTVTLNNGYGSPLSRQNHIHYDRKNNEICTQKMLGNCYDSSEMNFTYDPNKRFKIQTNTFQQVIEYNGKSGDTLKFTYREFSDNMARQPYTTDFTMDLSDGNTIGYKGALIEVIKASNSMIEYKLVKNFN